MKIIIVGAGEVGYYVASRLAYENKDVVVIDKDPAAIKRVSENLDVQAVQASGSSPRVLESVGIKGAEILLAVTDSDEANLVACLAADMLSPATRKIARIRQSDFYDYHQNLHDAAPHIDTIINPEIEAIKTLYRLMKVTGAVDVVEVAEGRAMLVGLRLKKGSSLDGVKLIDFPKLFGASRPLITAVVRNEELIVPRGNTRLMAGDLIYVIAEKERLAITLEMFGETIKPLKRVIIVGGGRLGERLAVQLENLSIGTKIIDMNLERCRELAGRMNKTIVLHGDGSDQKLLLEENVGDADVVISLTHDEHTNILVSLLAKSLGVKNTITRVSRFGYLPVLTTIGLEKTISPRLSAISSILQVVRKGKILSAVSVLGEMAEVIEAVALETSEITGKHLKKVPFPKAAILVCIIRKDQILIPTGDTVIEPDDRVVIFAQKEAINKLEKLLTVKLEFF